MHTIRAMEEGIYGNVAQYMKRKIDLPML